MSPTEFTHSPVIPIAAPFDLTDYPELAGIEAITGTGLVARTGAGTYATRTIAVPAAGITISNAGGVAGNPTLALANDLAALEALSSTGIAVRSTTDTWVQRTITGTTNQVNVANGDGVSGNPTLSTPQNIHTAATPTFAGIGLGTAHSSGRIQLISGTTSADGIFWGTDTNLYRSAANTLKTDDSLTIADTTASTSSTTGALIVSGGVGIAKDSWINSVRIGLGNGALSTNTVVGAGALAGANSGSAGNTAVGYQALAANTTGYANVAIGGTTLSIGTNAIANIAIGNTNLSANNNVYNVAIGHASQGSATGAYNVSVGGLTLTNTTNSGNIAIGHSAGRYVTSGGYNVAVGNTAGVGVTTGSNNVSIGYQAGYSTNGSRSIHIGYNAGLWVNGSSNVIIGSAEFTNPTSFSNNIILADGSGNIKYRYDATNVTYTANSGYHSFVSTGSAEQVRITHTASANRYITLTGSNGGNPTISVSAGSLAITPATVFASTISAGVATLDGVIIRGTSLALTNSFTIGPSASVNDINSLAIGSNCSAVGASSTAIGRNANTTAGGGTSLGVSASAGSEAVAIGVDTVAGSLCTSIGKGANTTSNSIAIGKGATTGVTASIAIGINATTQSTKSIVIGSPSAGLEILDSYFGTGEFTAVPYSHTIHASGGLGTDIAGANLGLAGGRPTGAGAGGYIFFSTAVAGLSSSTIRNLVERMRITSPGNVLINTTTDDTVNKLQVAGTISVIGGATLITTSTALTDGAGAGAGTLTNAPAAGDPTKWIGINDNGTTRYIPAW